LGHRGQDQGWIAHRSQIHEEHAIREVVHQRRRNVQAQAGLADAGGAGEGEQAGFRVPQLVVRGCPLALPPNERREQSRQMVLAQVDAAPGGVRGARIGRRCGCALSGLPGAGKGDKRHALIGRDTEIIGQ